MPSRPRCMSERPPRARDDAVPRPRIASRRCSRDAAATSGSRTSTIDFLSTLPDGWRCINRARSTTACVRSRSDRSRAASAPISTGLPGAAQVVARRTTILDAILTLPPGSGDAADARRRRRRRVDVLCVGGRTWTMRPLGERIEHLRAAVCWHWRGARDRRVPRRRARRSRRSRAGASASARSPGGARRAIDRRRCDDWIASRAAARRDVPVRHRGEAGAVLGRWSPLCRTGGANWSTCWRARRALQRGPEPFSSGELWPSLGAVTGEARGLDRGRAGRPRWLGRNGRAGAWCACRRICRRRRGASRERPDRAHHCRFGSERRRRHPGGPQNAAFDVYGAAVLTRCTAQNTRRVRDRRAAGRSRGGTQLDAVLDDPPSVR